MSEKEHKQERTRKEKKMNSEINRKKGQTQKEKMIKNIKRIRKTG